MSCGRWPPLRNPSTFASTPYAISGRVCFAIAQTKPESSRAIAAVITVFNSPHGRACDIDGRVAPGPSRLCLGLACSTFLGAVGDRDRYVLETGSSLPPRSRAIARLGDSALAARASAGMLGRNETQIGHELP